MTLIYPKPKVGDKIRVVEDSELNNNWERGQTYIITKTKVCKHEGFNRAWCKTCPKVIISVANPAKFGFPDQITCYTSINFEPVSKLPMTRSEITRLELLIL